VRTLTNELPCPVWVGHGEADRITSCKATQRLYDVLSAPGGDRTMRAFPDAYHRLEAEPEGTGEMFAAEVGEWCARRARGERGAVSAEARKSMHTTRKSMDVSRTRSPPAPAPNGGNLNGKL
jgi:hypothetical protein